ncbi:DUF2927 domain-containing protein [Palleronia sp. KMU-117]|uniref:DUF2927 domain-containing protein n=1 Tax=Palleronia sp. KMU-117 TaxID=3434108 RepID=UPI003D7319A0
MAAPPQGMAAPPPDAAPGPEPATRSEESIALEGYYARVQAGLLDRGLLRTDSGGTDAPFTDTDLARNFRQIAFFEEYSSVGGQLVQKETESLLHRWEGPVRMEVTFGRAVDLETRARDGQAIAEYADRLARVTGHPIRQVSSGGNFHVFVLYEDERREIGPELRRIIPRLDDTAVATVENLPRSSYCLVFAWDPQNDGVYTKAVAVIRAEHPDLFRLSCIHEELAQGLGLANDSPFARPSIFNDDEEFGLLTTHDEMLLKMLFDKRLRPGMSADEARPIIDQMAAELAGGTS